jgi:hypothetical protein
MEKGAIAKIDILASNPIPAHGASPRRSLRSNTPPHEYLCPISSELMTDPVMTEDGHTYERAEIEKWFATAATRNGRCRSPLTNAFISTNVVPNVALRKLIEDFVAPQPDSRPSKRRKPAAQSSPGQLAVKGCSKARN